MAERRLGAALREARGERNLALADISKRLHIKETFLDAIERGESAELFPRSYLTGYARSYGQLLEADIAAELDALSAELKRARDETVPDFVEPLPEGFLHRARGWFVAGGLVLAGIFLYGFSAEAPPAILVGEEPPIMAAPVATPPAMPSAAATEPRPVPPAPETQTPPTPPTPIPVDTAAEEPRGRAPTEELASARTKLVTRSVYLRGKPSNEAAPVATIARCTRVSVGDDLRSGWVEVTYGGAAGYLYRSFLKETMPSCGGGAQASR